MLNREQRQTLLEIARTSIERVLSGQRPSIDDGSIDAALKQPSGAFVTLRTRDGELRGCIGSIRPTAPLFQAVSSSALSAAFRDPRFPPVRADEMSDIVVEISAMGPIEPVASIDDIVVGRDGLIVSDNRTAGLLLPQVATEQGWDRERFLDHTCIKAGLPRGSWRSKDCRIEKFEAEVFGEDDL